MADRQFDDERPDTDAPPEADARLDIMVWAFLGEFPAAGLALGPTLEAWGWDPTCRSDDEGSVPTRTGDAADRSSGRRRRPFQRADRD